MRRAIRPFGGVPARQFGFQIGFCVHSLVVPPAPIIAAEFTRPACRAGPASPKTLKSCNELRRCTLTLLCSWKGMAKSRRYGEDTRRWLKSSKCVAAWPQMRTPGARLDKRRRPYCLRPSSSLAPFLRGRGWRGPAGPSRVRGIARPLTRIAARSDLSPHCGEVKKPTLRRPCSLAGAGYARISRPPEKSRGWRTDGARHAVSTHLLAKVWRLSARHRSVLSAPGRAFYRGLCPGVSELLAARHSARERRPGAARVQDERSSPARGRRILLLHLDASR